MRAWVFVAAAGLNFVLSAGPAFGQIGAFLGGQRTGQPLPPAAPWTRAPTEVRAVAVSDIVTMSLNPLNAGMVVLAVGTPPFPNEPMPPVQPGARLPGGGGQPGRTGGGTQPGGPGGGSGGGGGGGGGGSPAASPSPGGAPPLPPAAPPADVPPADYVIGLTPTTPTDRVGGVERHGPNGQTLTPDPVGPNPPEPNPPGPNPPGPNPPGPNPPPPTVETPEPGTLILAAIGAGVVGLARRRRRVQ